MRFINRGRQTGKSSMMVSTAYITGIPIVVDTISRKENLRKLAHNMGCDDILILTVQEMRDTYANNPKKVLIDEGSNTIEKALNEYLHTNVVATTFTIDMDILPLKIDTIASN